MALETITQKINLDASQFQSVLDSLLQKAKALGTSFTTKLSVDTTDLSKASDDTAKLGKSVEQMGSGFSRFSDSMSILTGNLLTKGLESLASGVKSVFTSMIDSNKEMETYTIQMTTLMGSADAAKQRLADLAKFGAETPFELPELVRAEKVLIGFGFNAKKAMELTGKSLGDFRTILGDVAAGTGQKFEDISLIMGKFSSGATGEAISRLQELGIVTKEEMKTMGIEFDKAGSLVSPIPKAMDAAVQAMEAKFGGGMKALSASAEGSLSTLADNVGAAMRDIGKPLFDVFKEGLNGVLNFLNSNLFKSIQAGLTTMMGGVITVFKALFDILNAIKIPLLIIVGAWAAYTGATMLATAVTTAFNAAWIANPIGVIIAGVVVAVTALAVGMKLLYDNFEPVRVLFDAIGSVFSFVGNLIWDVLVAGFKVFIEYGKLILQIVILPFQILFNLLSSGVSYIAGLITGFLGITKAGEGVGSILDWITKGWGLLKESAGKAIDFIIKGLQSAQTFLKGVADFFNLNKQEVQVDVKILDPTEQLNKLNESVNASKKTVDLELTITGYEKAKTDVIDLQNKLASAKTDGSSNAEIVKLTEQLESAKLKANELGNKLGKEFPAAVKGTSNEVVTLKNGMTEVRQATDLNIESIKKTIEAQKKLNGDEVQKNSKNTLLSLQQQTAEFKNQTDEYNKLQAKIAAGSATESEKKKYQELGVSIEENRKKVIKYAQDVVAGGANQETAINEVAKAYGITTEQATKLVLKTEDNTAAIEKAILSASKLSEAYSDLLSKGKKEADDSIGSFGLMQKAVKDLKNSAEKPIDWAIKNLPKATPDEQQNFANQLGKFLNDPKLWKDYVKNSKDAAKKASDESFKEQQDAEINKATLEKGSRLATTKAQKEFAAKETRDKAIELAKQISDVKKSKIEQLNAEQTYQKEIALINKGVLPADIVKYNEKIYDINKAGKEKLRQIDIEFEQDKVKRTEESNKSVLESTKNITKETYDSLNTFAKEGLLDGENLIKFSIAAKTKLQQEYQDSAVKIVENNQQYKVEKDNLDAQLKNGKINADQYLQLKIDLQNKILDIISKGSNEESTLVLNAQKKLGDDLLSLDETLWFNQQKRRILTTTQGIEQQQQLERLGLEKTLKESLIASKGNNQLQYQAYQTFIDGKIELDKKYLKQNQSVWDKLKVQITEVLNNINVDSIINTTTEYKNQRDAIKLTVQELEDKQKTEQDSYKQRLQQLEDEYKTDLNSKKDSGQAYSEYIKKKKDLDADFDKSSKSILKDLKDANDQLTDLSPWNAWKDGVVNILNDVANSFKQNISKEIGLYTKYNADKESLDVSYAAKKKAIEESEVLSTEAKVKLQTELTTKYTSDVIDLETNASKSYEVIMTETAAMVGTQLAAMVLDGKKNLGDFVGVFLDAADAMLPMLFMAITTKAFSGLEGLSLIGAGLLAAGAFASAKLVLATLKGAVLGKFKDGGEVSQGILNHKTGLVPTSTRVIEINETGEPEYIINAKATKKHKGLLDLINQGKDPSSYFKNKIDKTNIYSTNSNIDLTEMVKQQQITNQRLEQIENAQLNSYRRTKVEIEQSPLRVSGNDLVSVVDKINRKRMV